MAAANARFHVLWDHSQIWGLLLCRGLTALGAPFVPVRGAQVAAGILERQRPAALLVPGGFARRKLAAMTPAGAKLIRDYVAGGGNYLGLCGGAGLGLTHDDGLALCPWTRRPFADRLEHFVSGHVRLAPDAASPFCPPGCEETVEAPVWWPAGFAPGKKGDGQQDDVSVLAAYAGPGSDLLLADIPVSGVPTATLAACQARFGISLLPAFLSGGPCIVTGAYGQGRYILSHAHLETPGSGDANAWLAHILAVFSGASPPRTAVPAWNPAAEPVRFADPVLAEARRHMDEVIALGIEHRLLFRRSPWLLGWRPGTPGFLLSNLSAMLAGAATLPPTQAALAYWDEASGPFSRTFAAFAERLEGYFLAERLAATISRLDRPAGPEPGIARERRELFGPPPGTGGVCGELLDVLDELIWRLLAEGTEQPA